MAGQALGSQYINGFLLHWFHLSFLNMSYLNESPWGGKNPAANIWHLHGSQQLGYGVTFTSELMENSEFYYDFQFEDATNMAMKHEIQ